MAEQPPVATGTEMCEHMTRSITENGYTRDVHGRLKVKTCLGPSKQALGEHCGHTSAASSPICYACGDTTFNESPQGIIELKTCHYRCKKCKLVTRGCDVMSCRNCGSKRLTLLPPAINPDIYGFRVVNPQPR